MMITRIEAWNYRCFAHLAVDFGPFHVLAGANGSGKTTLLDILPLLGDLLESRNLADAFLRRTDGSARATSPLELLHKRSGDSIAFAVEARLPDPVIATLGEATKGKLGSLIPDHLRYELRLDVGPRGIRVEDEYLFLFAEEGVVPRPGRFPLGRPESGADLQTSDWTAVLIREGRSLSRILPETTTHVDLSTSPTVEDLAHAAHFPALRIPENQLALGAVPADETLFPAALWFADLLRDGIVFYAPDWEKLRRPAPPGDPLKVISSGVNTPWLALHLQQNEPEQFAFWVDHVQSALPQIAGIQVIEREEDHHAYFSVEYQGGYQVTSSGLSEGTLRILALTLLPYLGAEILPALLVTEEPENGIHPRAIETVLQSLSSLYESQVWVSTQSPMVLANTDLADVLAARIQPDGDVTVIPGSEHPQLRDWQGSLDLGTLFAAGVLS